MGHNDHLQEPIIERSRGTATGVCYKGIALTSSDFILIAPNVETLEDKWAIFTDAPLNREKCVEVAVFSQRDTKALPPEPAQPLNPLGK
jgi:hypothetical protein